MKGLLAVSALACAMNANASPVTWTFEGYTDGVGFGGGLCLALGCLDILHASFSGRVTYDIDAADQDPDPGSGGYLSAGGPYGFHLDIGAYSYDTDYVRTAVLYSGSSEQQYVLSSTQDGPWFNAIGIFAFWTFSLGVLSSDAQLRAPPMPWSGGYEEQYLRTLGGAGLALEITSIKALIPSNVPEPATYALMLAGIGALGFAARRRKGITA